MYLKTFAFYDRGAAYVLRQFHHLIPDKKLMCKVFEGSFADKEFRGGANFMPYTEEELKEIDEVDARTGDTWVPPPSVHPNFFELCDRFRVEHDAASEQAEVVQSGEADANPTPNVTS